MLTIGDFSRATLLTIKTLRHYHDTGLLEAAEVDTHTGYRRYLTSQIPQAQRGFYEPPYRLMPGIFAFTRQISPFSLSVM